MRLALGIFLLVWLLCGVAGAWMLDLSGNPGWIAIARGPITLVEAFQQEPN